MYVPNYIPEPEQVPGNLTTVLYAQRLQFIRQTLRRFVGAVAMIVGVGMLVPRTGDTLRLTIELLVCLLLVSSIRTFSRGTPAEPKVTAYTLPIVIGFFAVASRAWTTAGFPTWSVLVGIACFGIYASLCGRDFSFVGGYVLSLIFSSVLISFIMVEEGMTGPRSAQALLWNAGGLFYLVYDLAALLSRRRPNESWAASVDLFRDVFNFLGYFPRVMIHWNRHRILGDLSLENPFRT